MKSAAKFKRRLLFWNLEANVLSAFVTNGKIFQTNTYFLHFSLDKNVDVFGYEFEFYSHLTKSSGTNMPVG